jgi:hypothetical protein
VRFLATQLVTTTRPMVMRRSIATSSGNSQHGRGLSSAQKQHRRN